MNAAVSRQLSMNVQESIKSIECTQIRVPTVRVATRSWMTPAEVAERMKVSPITVRTWAQRGILDAEVTPGGHRRFDREVVDRFSRTWNPGANKGPLRILIVDDDEAYLGYLVELLSDIKGRETVLETAKDGFEAGQKVLNFRPNVVLLDQRMPGMNGTEVCKRIKSTPGNAEILVFAMSGCLTPEDISELMTAGADRCMQKPLDANELIEALCS